MPGDSQFDDIDALKAALHVATARALRVEAELAIARAKASDDEAIIAHQKLQIAKLRRALHGQRSERAVQLLDQMERGFEELESAATEDEIAAELAAARTTNVTALVRKRPSRQPFPAHLPRERGVEAAPAAKAGRGRDGDAGSDPPPVEGDPACAREIHLPGLREGEPGTGALPRHA